MKLNSREVVVFGILVGFAAIFVDAIIAHGLFWENDPYWTYWITKTFLIITVFTIGTAFLGIGIRQGLIIAGIHTLILEIYYEWLAPIGLPQEPMWLPFKDLWTLGVITHYLAILAGYFIALWLWYRSRVRYELASAEKTIRKVLFVTLAVLIVDAVITHGLVVRDFPGITFFVQHFLITFVFFMAWVVYIGFDLKGKIAASLLLALTWIAYSLYLSPMGLPNGTIEYLGYQELWLQYFPSNLVSIFLALWLVTKFRRKDFLVASGTAALVLLLFVFLPTTASAKGGMSADAKAEGELMFVVGDDPVDMKSTEMGNGFISINTEDGGNRWSHLQNQDKVDVSAEMTLSGEEYKVIIKQVMPRHYLGLYTTWSGVVYEAEMHGDTGIGTAKLPKVTPEIALWGYAEVYKGEELIAKAAPAHIMVMENEPIKGIMLEVETEGKGLLGTPDGYLNVLWPEISSIQLPEKEKQQRELIGWAALLFLTLLFGWWIIKEELKN